MKRSLFCSALTCAAVLLVMSCQSTSETQSSPTGSSADSAAAKPAPTAPDLINAGAPSGTRSDTLVGTAGGTPSTAKEAQKGQEPAAIQHGSPEQAKLDSMKRARTKGKK